MGTTASLYVYLITTLLHSLHHSENGDIPEQLKNFFRRFSAILADFERNERCIGDTIFYDDTLQQH